MAKLLPLDVPVPGGEGARSLGKVGYAALQGSGPLRHPVLGWCLRRAVARRGRGGWRRHGVIDAARSKGSVAALRAATSLSGADDLVIAGFSRSFGEGPRPEQSMSGQMALSRATSRARCSHSTSPAGGSSASGLDGSGALRTAVSGDVDMVRPVVGACDRDPSPLREAKRLPAIRRDFRGVVAHCLARSAPSLTALLRDRPETGWAPACRQPRVGGSPERQRKPR